MKAPVPALFFCVILCLLGGARDARGSEDIDVVKRAVRKTMDAASHRDRGTNEKLLLDMAAQYKTPAQQEEIFREIGLLFDQHYNQDTEKADPKRAAEYFEKAIAVRNSYRDSMMDARCWLVREYLALGDRKRFEECVADVLYVDLEQVLRDEYDADFMKRYMVNWRASEYDNSEVSPYYKSSRRRKLNTLRETVRARYETHVMPWIAGSIARDIFNREGVKGIQARADRIRNDEPLLAKLLEKEMAQFSK